MTPRFTVERHIERRTKLPWPWRLGVPSNPVYRPVAHVPGVGAVPGPRFRSKSAANRYRWQWRKESIT